MKKAQIEIEFEELCLPVNKKVFELLRKVDEMSIDIEMIPSYSSHKCNMMMVFQEFSLPVQRRS